MERRAGRGEEGWEGTGGLQACGSETPRHCKGVWGVLEGSGHQRGCSVVWDSEHTDRSTPAEEPPPYGPLRAAGQEGYSVLGAAQTPLLRRPGRARGPPSASVPPLRSSEAFSPAPRGREQASPPRPLPAGWPRGPCSCNCTADIHRVCRQKVGKSSHPLWAHWPRDACGFGAQWLPNPSVCL